MFYPSSSTRFSLLLLEEGEYYLEDFSVYFCIKRRVNGTEVLQRQEQGRLMLCTRSIMFEPQTIEKPIIKYPFRSFSSYPEIHQKETKEYLLVRSYELYEMRTKGADHPYRRKVYKSTEGWHIPLKHEQIKTACGDEIFFDFLHTKSETILGTMKTLYAISKDMSIVNRIDEETALSPILQPRHTDDFNSVHLVDFSERSMLSKGIKVYRICPLLTYPGCIMLTDKRLYFQPAPINNTSNTVESILYSKIQRIYNRRHMLRRCGMEIIVDKDCLSSISSASHFGGSRKDSKSIFFKFETAEERDEIFTMITTQPSCDHLNTSDRHTMLLKWQKKQISNYDYLLYLNDEAGRTTNDLTQYPVFPWVIADYTSSILDLEKMETFRDLSKPIGALSKERLEQFIERFRSLTSLRESPVPPFLYGTHYSTPAYILYYLVRQSPEYMLCLQNGKFDAPDRLFQSIEQTWESCLTNPADLKELIPCFYSADDIPPHMWLVNYKHLDLGTTQKHARVNDVALPRWASSPEDFILKNRQALESPYVSEHLHEWINLIFGYKQQGNEAADANNLFYYLSYEGAVNIDEIKDSIEKASIEAQIQEFGQTPSMLFASPHPRRDDQMISVTLAVSGTYIKPEFNQPIDEEESCKVSETEKTNKKPIASPSTTFGRSFNRNVFRFPKSTLGVPSFSNTFTNTADFIRKKTNKYRR